MSEALREVKVVTFLEKARNPLTGMVGLLEILSDVIFKGEQEILRRSLLR